MHGIGAHGPLGPIDPAGRATLAFDAEARGDGAHAVPGGLHEPRRGAAPLAREPAPLVGERAALAVLVSVEGLGPVTLGRLVGVAGGARAVLELARSSGGVRALRALGAGPEWDGPAIAPDLAGRVVAAALDEARIVDAILGAGVGVVTIADRAYPARLRAIALPPHLLFVRGEPAALSAERMVAVVGTRRPSTAGRELAARIGRSLARAGAAVASGLAIGIDGAAHAAVVGERGVTVGVIAGGHDRLYPKAHARLAGAIIEAGGAIVSEMAPDVAPTRGTFPRRNRLISGLSEATIVVEAPPRSGALTTAAWALEQGRGCFLVPGGLDAPQSAGCLAFLREASGEARIVAGVPELLDDLGLAAAAGLPAPSARRSPRAGTFAARGPSRVAVLGELDPTPRRIAECLLAGATTVDELVAVTDLAVAAVLGALTRLESADLVTSAYGRYVVSGRLAA